MGFVVGGVEVFAIPAAGDPSVHLQPSRMTHENIRRVKDVRANAARAGLLWEVFRVEPVVISTRNSDEVGATDVASAHGAALSPPNGFDV